MGYILPVENYTYAAYQERTKVRKREKTEVNKPFKAILDKRHEEIKSEHERFHPMTKLRPKHVYVDEEHIAMITGKGRRFRQTI